MADLDQAILDDAVQQEAAQRIRRERLQAQQQRTDKFKKSLPGGVGRIVPDSAAEVIQQEIQQAAITAYTKLWQELHEAVEGFAFAYFMVGALLAAPIADVLYGFRLLVGKAMNGGFQIERNGISVPAVPDIGSVEMAYRGAKLLFISIVGGLEWVIIIVTIYFIAHPTSALQLGWQAITRFFSGAVPTISGQ